MKTNFATWLNAVMNKKKMSGLELAKRSGIGYSSIAKYRRGKRRPLLHTASRLADALGVKL